MAESDAESVSSELYLDEATRRQFHEEEEKDALDDELDKRELSEFKRAERARRASIVRRTASRKKIAHFVPLHLFLPSRSLMTLYNDSKHHGRQVMQRLQALDPHAADDLSSMHLLSEDAIIKVLEERFVKDKIYTRLGPRLLLAINPFRVLPNLYSDQALELYLSPDEDSDGDLIYKAPHVYSVAANAYRSMVQALEQRDAEARGLDPALSKASWGVGNECLEHSILISGESGAGKTESAKKVMQFLTFASAKVDGAPGSAGESSAAAAENGYTRRVLESNPLLEAFGNAKTSCNDNSSRFGKFIELHFSTGGAIRGVSIKTYLLEKTRVVMQPLGERNFHIFHRLLAPGAADLLTAHGIPDADEMALAGGEGAFAATSSISAEALRLRGEDDLNGLKRTLHAMTTVGLSTEEVGRVLSCAAGILHLSNVTFCEGEGGEGAVFAEGSDALARKGCDLLKLDAKVFESAVTTRTMEMARESIVVRLSALKAAAARDAICKLLHAVLFDWMLCAVNKAIGGGGTGTGRVGILDIFGFEDVEGNSLEQLLINYANEAIQKFFTGVLFEQEKRLFDAEGLGLTIDYADNAECIALIDGPGGILRTLDDECKFGERGTDENFVGRLYRAHEHLQSAPQRASQTPARSAGGRTPSSTTQRLSQGSVAAPDPPTPSPRPRGPVFSFDAKEARLLTFRVRHYAGSVLYGSEGFLAKNRDEVPQEAAALLRGAACTFLASAYGNLEGRRDGAPTPKRQRGRLHASTVSLQFRESLCALLASLRSTCSHFVRCVKPNGASAPGAYEAWRTQHQLRCAGVFEAIRVARLTFPVRLTHERFYDRYARALPSRKNLPSMLAFHDMQEGDAQLVKDFLYGLARSILNGDGAAEGDALAPDAETGRSPICIGSTKVFLSIALYRELEAQLEARLHMACIMVQRCWKSVKMRRLLRAMRVLAQKVNRIVRGYLARKRVERRRRRLGIEQRTSERKARREVRERRKKELKEAFLRQRREKREEEERQRRQREQEQQEQREQEQREQEQREQERRQQEAQQHETQQQETQQQEQQQQEQQGEEGEERSGTQQEGAGSEAVAALEIRRPSDLESRRSSASTVPTPASNRVPFGSEKTPRRSGGLSALFGAADAAEVVADVAAVIEFASPKSLASDNLETPPPPATGPPPALAATPPPPSAVPPPPPPPEAVDTAAFDAFLLRERCGGAQGVERCLVVLPRPSLGCTFTSLFGCLAVRSVPSDSLAWYMGLRADDLVVGVNGESVAQRTCEEARRLVSHHLQPRIAVIRRGCNEKPPPQRPFVRRQELDFAKAEAEAQVSVAEWTKAEELRSPMPYLGAALGQLFGRLALSIVEEGSPAQHAGLREGDVLASANGRSLLQLSAAEAIKVLREELTLRLRVLRRPAPGEASIAFEKPAAQFSAVVDEWRQNNPKRRSSVATRRPRLKLQPASTPVNA